MINDVSFHESAQSFRRFFVELREAFLERESLFTQIELGLLCKEHVLAIGPPGTAKSAIASAVLGRIVDEKTLRPSLFSKQLAENTVQTDLIGPVDFKVLTETGRTEHLTDDGMLGATHAFLDEVFDGRDMLLRSILNVLQERELKHGRKVTLGKTECAIMTSNRYLSEVLQRSPETLLAFADRISYICFCPKAFARKSSRAQMLQRATSGQRIALAESLTLQQLDLLQEAVAQVEVPGFVAEGLEQLSDLLEKELLAQVVKLPDYVPTKYFSQRSMVKALWSLKAAVVRDRIYRKPDRPLVATAEDLPLLRSFFLLGGPPPEDLETLVKSAADPRERAQLEIIRTEHRAFDEVLKKVQPGLEASVEREAAELTLKEDLASAESQMLRGWQPAIASTTARSLRAKLVPGPRHPENRRPLVQAAGQLASALEARLLRGMAGQGEGRGGVAVLASFSDGLELLRGVPELKARLPGIAKAAADFCGQAAEMTVLAADGTEFDESLKLEALSGMSQNLAEELSRIVELLQPIALAAPEAAEAVRATVLKARERVAQALHRRAARTFQQGRARKGEAIDALAADSRRLKELEDGLVALSPKHRGLRTEFLGPLGQSYARELLATAPFNRVEVLTRTVQQVIDTLRSEGVPPESALGACRPLLEERLKEHARALASPPKVSAPEGQAALEGQAYLVYRQQLSATAPDGELAALVALETLLTPSAPAGEPYFGEAVHQLIATAELASLSLRIRYLRAWLSQLLGSLPGPDEMKGRAEADRAFDRLVKSRFPMLATKEGELVRLQGAVQRLLKEPGDRGELARKMDQALRDLADDFATYSRKTLELRMGRAAPAA